MNIAAILTEAFAQGATACHFTVGSKPYLKAENGWPREMSSYPRVQEDDIPEFISTAAVRDDLYFCPKGNAYRYKVFKSEVRGALRVSILFSRKLPATSAV